MWLLLRNASHRTHCIHKAKIYHLIVSIFSIPSTGYPTIYSSVTDDSTSHLLPTIQASLPLLDLYPMTDEERKCDKEDKHDTGHDSSDDGALVLVES